MYTGELCSSRGANEDILSNVRAVVGEVLAEVTPDLAEGRTEDPATTHTMQGTEKQVRWAERIVDMTIGILTDALQEEDAHEDSINAMINALRSAEYATDVIDLFRDVRRTSSPRRDAEELEYIYAYATPKTKGQRKLLLRPDTKTEGE